MKSLIIRTVLVMVQSVLCLARKCPVIDTKYGSIVGISEYSSYGTLYHLYRGIPYAKPPVGELRFKASELPDKWEGILDARKDGPYCIQKNYLFANPKIEGDEDCLYLNVYVPANHYGSLLPVMVLIPWGAFIAGRGTSDYFHPDYFMDKNVVLVSFNYRLGIFGFLSTLDDAAPGNWALKDQRAALRWVQENIENFGGDKNRVTIFGQSAGGGSTHYHLLSPSSRGLFQRAISQSGSAMAVWSNTADHTQTAAVVAAQASFVGCEQHVGNSKGLIECLRKISAEKLLESQELFKTFDVNPLTVYFTVTENQTEANPDPFFTKSPIEYVKSGEFYNVPWIIGVAEEEGLLKAEGLLRQTLLREQLNAKFDRILSDSLLGFSLSSSNPENLTNNIIKYYLNGEHFINISNPRSIKGFIDLYSDRLFHYPAYQSVMLHSAMGHRPIWFYTFNYKGQYSYGDYFAATNETIDYDWGVCHCDDLLYLFKSPGLFPPLQQGNDLVVRNVMINFWTNFAIYGDPNPCENRFQNLVWNPVNINGLDDMKNENLCYLDMKGHYQDQLHLCPKCGFEKKRMKFWSSQNLFENFEGLD